MVDLDLAELRRLAEAAKEHLATGHRHSVAPIVALMDANGPDVVLQLLDRLEAAEAAEKQAHAVARLRAGAHQMAGERFDGVCMAVFAKAAEGGSLADVVDLVADWMQECVCVDDESTAAYERARAAAERVAGEPESAPAAEPPIRSYSEYLERFLPEEAERRRRAGMTPSEVAEEIGREAAAEALAAFFPAGSAPESGATP